jgi:hypothetical protein
MATSSDDTEYVCTLSDELIVKAEEELNEKAEWRARDIQALREMILKKPGKTASNIYFSTCFFLLLSSPLPLEGSLHIV